MKMLTMNNAYLILILIFIHLAQHVLVECELRRAGQNPLA
jgi:hypothetical protein